MKQLLLITTLFSFLFFSSKLHGQDCINLPDTIYHCGFEVQVNPVQFDVPGFWIYNCDMGDGNVAIDMISTTNYIITFSNCGYYSMTFYVEECNEEKTVVFKIDDPSYTNTEIVGNNDLGYFTYSCHSDGSSCDNVVTIDGELPPTPEWEICYELSCDYKHFFTESIPANPTDCIAQEILLDSISGNGFSQACELFAANEITAENFCDIVGDIYNLAEELSTCPEAPAGCFEPGVECIDSVSTDTLIYLFPIHDGGRWTMLENMDTIILSDTTLINKYMKDLLFIIDPGADYYGPGDLTFTLLEITTNGDTIPTAFDAEFTLWWQELWHYDTLTEIVNIIHYSDEPECQSCGGNSFASSKNIPGIPDYLCPPITISFGDPCSCEEGSISITGGSLNCIDPCTVLDVSINFSDPQVTIDSSYWTGPFGSQSGSGSITVCEPGTYTFTVITSPNGCEYSESFEVIEEIVIPEAEIGGPYIIDCLNPCVEVEIFLVDPTNTIGSWTFPDGSFVDFNGQPDPITVCTPGTIVVTLFDIQTGCTNDYFIEVIDETEDIDFQITVSGNIDCNNDCVSLFTDPINIPVGSSYNWSGPNGFTDTQADVFVCEPGIYVLVVSYGECVLTQSIEVFEFLDPVEMNQQVTLCDGNCYIFGGIEYCIPGTYSYEGECDTTWNLELFVENPTFVNKYEFICEGDQIEVDGMIFSNEGIHNYELDLGGFCPEYVSLEIEVFEMDLFVSGTPSVDCNNTSTTLTVSTSNPEQNFYWYNPQNQVVSTTNELVTSLPGIYTVQNVSSNNLCVAEITIEVTGNLETPELNVSSSQYINCENEIELNIDVDSSDNLTFYWTGPNIPSDQVNLQNPKITGEGIYEVIIENEFGCTNTGLIEVILLDQLEAELSSEESCMDQANGRIEVQIESGGIGPFKYRLQDGGYQDGPIFENVEPGEYTVYIQQADGCEWESNIIVDATALIEPSVFFDDTYELCDKPSIEFDLSQDISNHQNWNIEWFDGGNQSKRTFTEAGDYSLTVSNECELREYFFKVEDSRLQDDLPIFIANIFSPNNDGVNDEFKIHTPLPPNNFSIDIYDRWGNKVFSSDNIDFSWNGNIHNVTSKSDVYAYIAKYSYLECKDESKDFKILGDVTVIR